MVHDAFSELESFHDSHADASSKLIQQIVATSWIAHVKPLAKWFTEYVKICKREAEEYTSSKTDSESQDSSSLPSNDEDNQPNTNTQQNGRLTVQENIELGSFIHRYTAADSIVGEYDDDIVSQLLQKMHRQNQEYQYMKDAISRYIDNCDDDEDTTRSRKAKWRIYYTLDKYQSQCAYFQG